MKKSKENTLIGMIGDSLFIGSFKMSRWFDHANDQKSIF